MSSNYLQLRSELLAQRPFESLSATEARNVAAGVQHRFWDAYSNPKHVDHALVSSDVRQLYARADALTAEQDKAI